MDTVTTITYAHCDISITGFHPICNAPVDSSFLTVAQALAETSPGGAYAMANPNPLTGGLMVLIFALFVIARQP